MQTSGASPPRRMAMSAAASSAVLSLVTWDGNIHCLSWMDSNCCHWLTFLTVIVDQIRVDSSCHDRGKVWFCLVFFKCLWCQNLESIINLQMEQVLNCVWAGGGLELMSCCKATKQCCWFISQSIASSSYLHELHCSLSVKVNKNSCFYSCRAK